MLSSFTISEQIKVIVYKDTLDVLVLKANAAPPVSLCERAIVLD
jgi:hypothetical protein